MNTTRLLLIAAAVLALGGGQLFAQATWDGGSGNWNDANWSGGRGPGGAPARGDNVAIPSGTVTVSSDLVNDIGSFGELSISDDGTLEIAAGGRLDFSGQVVNNASLYIAGGELQSGNFWHATVAGTEAELDISGPSVIDAVGDFDPCWEGPVNVSITGSEADINASNDFWYCSNVTLNANIDGDTFSAIKVGNQVIIGGGSTLNVAFVDGYMPDSVGKSWILADGSSRSGAIGNLNINTPLPKGTAIDLSYREGGENGQIVALDFVNTLNLRVNSETGGVLVENPFPGASPLDIDGYIIRSESGSLVEGNFGGLGEPGWLTGLDPSQSDGLLSESNLQLSTLVAGDSKFSLGNIYRVGGTKDLAFEFHASGGETMLGTVEYSDSPEVQPGDANRDLSFDQLDIIQVLNGAKYMTGQSASWGEGDWDGGPGGTQDFPPAGNGLFDQLDIVAALAAGWYLNGPYAATVPGGESGDGQTSIGSLEGGGGLGDVDLIYIPVPEPSALVLLALGVFCVLGYSRRSQ